MVDAITYLPSLEQDIELQEREILVEIHVLYLYKGSNAVVKSCETVAVDVLTERCILPVTDVLKTPAMAYCPEADIDTERQVVWVESEAVQLCP